MALSLLCCFSNNMNATIETTTIADIFGNQMVQFELVGCCVGQQAQLKFLDNTLIPNAHKEQDIRCPNFLKRLISKQTDEEKESYQGALRRRQLRLILSGRMKPSEAKELRSIFDITADKS